MVIVGEGGARAASEAARGGADLLQVRARYLSSRGLLQLVREVVAEIGSADRVIVNSRPDIAMLTGARGVHLPESGLDPASVRAAFPELLVGVSRHDRSGLERAVVEGAEYALLGPVFATPGKEARAMGAAGFADLTRNLELPVVAVGGLGRDAIGAVIGSAAGVAAVRPFASAETAFEEAQAWRRMLDGAR